MKRKSIGNALLSIVALFGIGHAADSTLLAIGAKAPDFTLQTHKSDTVTLSKVLASQYVTLIFYPGDNTPGCTKQLCAVRDDWAEFTKRNVAVYGVNTGKIESKKSFASKNNFPFPLLIDEKGVVTKSYGAKGALMAKRTVYVIDPSGKIIFAQRGMPTNSEILSSIPGANSPSEDFEIKK